MQRAGSDTVLDERSGAMMEAKIVTQRVPDSSISAADVAAVAELLSKVEALLQRPADVRETVLSVGSLQLDLMTRTVSRNGRTIDLLPREFRLLAYMMRHEGQLVTRAMLFREVWNYKFVPESNLVDVHIGRLRRKIDQSDEAPMIYSVRGHGFVLHAPANARPPRKLAPDVS
jgi:two-component system OmpR family response regulator